MNIRLGERSVASPGISMRLEAENHAWETRIQVFDNENDSMQTRCLRSKDYTQIGKTQELR